LKRRYFDTFIFYFAKPINEMIANVSCIPSIIWMNDHRTWDNGGEFLKRYGNVFNK
jgi:hypothetical protein